MKGFTLLEVMVSLAIMAGVILTLLGAVNYHISVIEKERDSVTLTLLARAQMSKLEIASALVKGEGSLAPAHPELTWSSDLLPSKLPGLQKLVLKVQRTSDKRGVVLVRYLPK